MNITTRKEALNVIKGCPKLPHNLPLCSFVKRFKFEELNLDSTLKAIDKGTILGVDFAGSEVLVGFQSDDSVVSRALIDGRIVVVSEDSDF